MGCNCGKTKTRQTASQPPPPPPPPQPEPPKGQTQSFALDLRDGSRLSFGSRLEAEAENVRLGYTGTVHRV